jgi:hypothetical protein
VSKLQTGILGGPKGKVGGVVGFRWKDKDCIRGYAIPANPNTTAQQTQRGLMKNCVAFAKLLVGQVFNKYTDKFIRSMSGFNYFVKANIKVFDGTTDYSAIKVTEGQLYAPEAVTATLGVGSVTVAFNENLGNNGAATDKVYAVCFDETTGIMYFPAAEVARSVKAIVITVPGNVSAADLHVWCLSSRYVRTLVEMISNSVYSVVTE